MVLINKGVVKDFMGVGKLEVMWKSTTDIINQRLTSVICYHNTIHGFQTGRGTGTATLEDNIFQHMIPMRDSVLRTIFMDLQKAYVTLDWDRHLDIL